MRKVLTLCLVTEDGKVLLGMKKRGFGAGRWNGFGGKVGAEESIEDAACRELFEEAGITATRIEKRGVMLFDFVGDPEVLEVHLYHVAAYQGVPAESEEMAPKWFRHAEIPFEQMWPDDRHWMPRFLNGERFRGVFHFEDQNTLLSFELHSADQLP